MHLLTAEDYDQLWQYSRSQSSLYNKGYDPSRWQAFWDQYAPTYLAISRSLMKENQRLVSTWLQEGILSDCSEVMDIGCGPGTYTLPLAAAAKSVTGVDNARMMVDIISHEAQLMGIRNLRVINEDWNTLDWQDAFDLVVAANCPAVNSQQALDRMTVLSRQYCLYLCYAGKRSLTIRDVLWEKIMGEKLQGKPFDISFPFNILYQKGFLPRLTFVDQRYSYSQPAETIVRNFTKYFSIFGKSEREVATALEQELSRRSSNGVFEETVSLQIGIMWWSASRE